MLTDKSNGQNVAGKVERLGGGLDAFNIRSCN